MPGIYGAAGSAIGHATKLRSFFEEIWQEVSHRQVSSAALGWHTFRGFEPSGEGESVTVWDGGWQAELGPGSPIGNEVTIDERGSVVLRTDVTGTFPLYYRSGRDGITFSSHLRPLARVLGAEPDPVAVAQFLRFGWTLAGRSLFRGIKRVEPGQVIEWHPGRGLSVKERSDAWVGLREDLADPEQVAEEAAGLVRSAVEGSLHPEGSNVLMASAGWDSRTLLAASVRWQADRVSAFSHGDLESRELRITEALARKAGVPWTARRIDADVWDPGHLELTAARTESLIFPHWAWAARVNAEASCIFSGIYGEVLGGHYGSTQVAGGVGKVTALIRGFAPDRESGPVTDETIDDLAATVMPPGLRPLWYLRDEIEGGHRAELHRAMMDDARRDLTRLRVRGVRTTRQLLEAFITEHRGVQYIAAQALSCRVGANVAIPFAVEDLFRFASVVPGHLKIHNRVSRATARRLAPDLLGFPLAATLVPASWPLLIQEGSRLLRKVYGVGRRRLSVRTGGRLTRPRLSWVNFEFLRHGSTARRVVESLRSDLWDLPEMARRVESFQTGSGAPHLHSFFDQMGKILTVDRITTWD